MVKIVESRERLRKFDSYIKENKPVNENPFDRMDRREYLVLSESIGSSKQTFRSLQRATGITRNELYEILGDMVVKELLNKEEYKGIPIYSITSTGRYMLEKIQRGIK